MEKNNLKKIFPEIEAGRSIKTLAERTEGEAVILSAQKKGGILALSVFFNDDLRKGETLPRIITFFEKKPNWDFISRKRAEDSQTYKWSEASFINMPEDPLYQTVIMANKKTEKILNSFFSEKMFNTSSIKRIKSFQREVKERKLKEKQEQKRKKILEEMNINNDPPKPFFDWVDDISEKYFFFTKEKKDIKYLTTCCEKKGTARMEKISFKHNKFSLCPLCGKKVKFVSSKKSSYKYQQLNACFIQKDGQRTIFRYFSYFHHSNSDGNNKKYIEECLRTIVTDEKVVRYEKIGGEWKHSPRNGERISWTTLVPKSGLELYGCAYIYPGNLPEEIKGDQL